jgi:dimethylglycine dehydrogenase
MDRFIKADKGDFIGRDALLEWQERGIDNLLVTLEVHDVEDADALGNNARGIDNLLVTLEVHDVEDADALGNNALTQDGVLIGRATGGGYGFRVGKSLALGMVSPEYAEPGTEISIEILGKEFGATVIADSPFDPKNERLRDVNGANEEG